MALARASYRVGAYCTKILAFSSGDRSACMPPAMAAGGGGQAAGGVGGWWQHQKCACRSAPVAKSLHVLIASRKSSDRLEIAWVRLPPASKLQQNSRTGSMGASSQLMIVQRSWKEQQLDLETMSCSESDVAGSACGSEGPADASRQIQSIHETVKYRRGLVALQSSAPVPPGAGALASRWP